MAICIHGKLSLLETRCLEANFTSTFPRPSRATSFLLLVGLMQDPEAPAGHSHLLPPRDSAHLQTASRMSSVSPRPFPQPHVRRSRSRELIASTCGTGRCPVHTC